MLEHNKKRGMVVLAILLAAAILTAVLKPRYDAFVASEYEETCYGARWWIGIVYHTALRDATKKGISLDQMDDEKLVRKIVSSVYDVNLAEDLSSDELCHGGGHVQILIDEKEHTICITCSAEDHQDYDDEVINEESYNDTANYDYGVDVTTCLK